VPPSEPDPASQQKVRARIIRAAADLMREGGPSAVTTRSVAEHAGVQPPTIYRLLTDKEGLLDAVGEYEIARYVAEKSAVSSGDPVVDLRTAWDNHIQFGMRNPALYSYMADPVRVSRSAAASSGLDAMAVRVRAVAAAGRLRVSEERAARLMRAGSTGAVMTILSSPERDARADTLREAIMSAILTDAPKLPGDPSRNAAVALRAGVPGLDVLSPGEKAVMTEWLDRITGH
jgi:AcrR family transcriptional regulator